MSTTRSKKHSALRKQLSRIDPIMKGSLAEVKLTCGTPGCRCHAKGPKHKGMYFSYRYEGTSHTVYIPKGMQEYARKAHGNWKRLKDLLEKLTDMEVKQLQRGKRRRPKTRKGGHR